LSRSLVLPEGYRIRWYGEYKEMRDAQRRLLILTPLAVGLMFLLLYWSYRSVKYAMLQLLSVPFALIGGSGPSS